MLITKRSLLAVLATNKKGYSRDKLHSYIVREWWNEKHVARMDRIINSAIRRGLAFVDYPDGEDKPGSIRLAHHKANQNGGE